MKVITTPILVLIFAVAASHSWAKTGRILTTPKPLPSNCEHFLGSWHSETFNPRFKYTNIQTATYRSDGKLVLKITIRTEDGRLIEEPEVVRDWYCDGNVYITRNDPSLEAQEENPNNGPHFKVYRLLGTTPDRIRYRTIVGHTPGVVYTLERGEAPNK